MAVSAFLFLIFTFLLKAGKDPFIAGKWPFATNDFSLMANSFSPKAENRMVRIPNLLLSANGFSFADVDHS
jgi:hypothetical protein